MAIVDKGSIINIDECGFCKTANGFLDFPQDMAGKIGEKIYYDEENRRSTMEDPNNQGGTPPGGTGGNP